jgi:hypothetical protein
MVSISLQPLVCLNILERPFFIDVTVGGKNINIILILEAINEIYNRPDGPTCFESRCIPVAENK